MSNPEMSEYVADPFLSTFELEELPELTLMENKWGTVSPQFVNGDELLGLFLFRNRAIDYGYAAHDPRLDRELSPESSRIERLDRALTSHWIPRSFLFESKIKFEDQAANYAVKQLVSFSDNYGFSDATGGLDETVESTVKEKKTYRTKSLLHDLTQHYTNLELPEVWFRVHSFDGPDVHAAQLVGFTLHGEGDHVAVEPIVQSEGTIGLLPDHSYVDPYVSVRLKA